MPGSQPLITASGAKRAVRGATLVDVITIIAILFLLGALVFPLIVRGREQSRQRVCFANLRQLSQAIQLYAQDYDGYPPPASIDWGKTVPGKTWYSTMVYWPLLIYPYIGSSEPFWCPSAPFERPAWGSGVEWHTYAINVHVSPRVPLEVKPEEAPRRLSEVVHPEDIGLMIDSSGVCLLSAEEIVEEPEKAPYLFPAFYTDGYTSGRRTAYPSHNDGVDIAYLDGHVRWLPIKSFLGNPEVVERFWGSPYSP
ncbi:MAG: hypothetical protein OHK0029_37440 [Armatimonadaceae bacterium]